MEPNQAQMVFCCAEQWMGGRCWQIEPWGDSLRLDCGKSTTGVYCMEAVDSGENGFCWSRAVIEADLPPDTALRVYAYASDSRGWGEWSDLDEAIRNLEGDPLVLLREVLALQRRRAETFLSAPRAGIYGLCSNWRPQGRLLR